MGYNETYDQELPELDPEVLAHEAEQRERRLMALRGETEPKGIDDAIAAGYVPRPMTPKEEAERLAALRKVAGVTGPADGEDWPELEILKEASLPKWPEGVLPDVIERFTDELAEESQTSPDLSKLHSLAVLAVPVQGRFEVEVRPGYRETLSLYTQAAAETGERKTAVDGPLSAPIRAYESEAREACKEMVRENRRRKVMLESLVESSKKKAAKTMGDPDAVAAYNENARELDEFVTLSFRRLLVDDVTPEVLPGMMASQGGSIGVLSAEANFVEAMMGRYTDGKSLSVFPLRAYSGEPITIDRIGRAGAHVERPALTLGLMTQPDHLKKIMGDPLLKGRGLLERFLFALPPRKVGNRKQKARAVSRGTSEAYERTIRALCPPMKPTTGKPWEPVRLRFSLTADQALLEFAERLEPRLGEDGDLDHIRGWGARLPGQVVRIATLFHLAEAASRDRLLDGEVSEDCVLRAVKLAEEYLLPMALRVWGWAGTSETNQIADELIQLIRRKGWTEFSMSDLKMAKRYLSDDDRSKALERLENLKALRRTEIRTSGRTKTVFLVHPDL